MKLWGDKRYLSLNYFLRSKFSEKVFKISIDGGFSCPNRDGKISSLGCIFCSEKGSGDFAGNRNHSIKEQFNEIKDIMNRKWKNGKYIVYFQAYTNTYGDISDLRQKYYEALNNEDVVGIAISTRPDCLSKEVLDLLDEINKKTYLWVELGLQTIHEETSNLINRGYNLNVFEEAVTNLRNLNIDIVVHLILGLPGENSKMIYETVKYVSNTDIQGVKFHLLHLMKNTPLINMYNEGKLKFLKMDEYVELICKSISYLRDDIVIHRLTGDSPRDTLIEPKWSLKKWEILNAIDKYLELNNLYQSSNNIKN